MILFTAVRRGLWIGLRRPWVLLAGAIAVLQFFAIWFVSARGTWGMATTPRARHVLVPASDSDGRLGSWLWLMHPGVMLAPTPDDFSSGAWLQRRGMVVEFESVKRTDQPLPFEPLARIEEDSSVAAGLGGAHGWTWELPAWIMNAPQVEPVPFPRETVARILGAPEGITFRAPPVLPRSRAGAAPDTLVLRLALDATGAVATPPVVWESSGDAALDAELTTRAMTWLFDGVGVSGNDGARVPILIRIDWGVDPPDSGGEVR